jgi:Ca-activated chloride channel family protein
MNSTRSGKLKAAIHRGGPALSLRFLLAAALMTLLSTAIAGPLLAQGWIDPGRRSVPIDGLVKVRTSVAVQVTGRVATVEVEEWFRNEGGMLAEGDYIYPLPGEAVFSNFSLFQGDEELRGELLDADEARSIYEEIVRRKKDPALIELVGHGLVRARVFPIDPGETRKITLRYTQVLERSGDALRFRYSAAGRRGSRVVAGDEARLPRRLPEPAPLSFVLGADDAGRFGEPFSPTHDVRVEREDGVLTVRPVSELDGDFTLFLPLAGEGVGVTVATHRPSGEDGYFMLTLSPGEAAGTAQARDLTVVLDVSGSMSGAKLDQAKQALRQLLGSLGETDRFRLIAFSSGVRAYRQGWTRVTGRELREARGWVTGLDADGGTNISGALDEALGTESPDDRLPIVVFLTDGLPSVGEEDPERIADQADRTRGRARVFAFGVGYDVNTYLLDRLSGAGRGATEYVEPGEDVEVALSSLAIKIRRPILVDLEIADAPVRFTEVYPKRLPDLFAGEDMIVFGRYEVERRALRGRIELRGRRNGREERFAVQAEFPTHELGNDFIPRLWASRKLAALTRTARLEGATEELIDEIRSTALRYGLLSEYTSYLVLDAVAARRGGVGGVNGAAVPMSAPSASVGEEAVVAAKSVAARSRIQTAQELEANERTMAVRLDLDDREDVAGFRQQANRSFRLEGETWVDVAHSEQKDVAEVKPFSDAYFDLLERLPELRPLWRDFERVLVAGAEVSVRLAADGATRLSNAELDRIVRQFRG